MKQETNARICWWGVAACCGLLALSNLMLPLGTVHSRSRTNKRIADLEAAGNRPVSAQELHDALVDVQHINLAAHKLLNMNFYLPATIFVISVIGATSAGKRKEPAQPATPPYSEPAARSPQR